VRKYIYTVVIGALIPVMAIGGTLGRRLIGQEDIYWGTGTFTDSRGTTFNKLPRYWDNNAFTDNLTLYGNDLILKGPWVDVRAYGAGTDNTAAQNSTAINAAIDNATSLGGTVLFPPGTYTHNGITMKNNVILKGSGKNATTLIYTGSDNAVTGNFSYSGIRDMALYQTGSNWAIVATNFSYSDLTDLVITARKGVFLKTSINSGLNRVRIGGQGRFVSGGTGFQVGDTAGGAAVATTTTLTDVYSSGFEKSIVNDQCIGLVLVNAIVESGNIGLYNRTSTIGTMYSEDIDGVTVSAGAHAPVPGETIHGNTSGATGVVSLAHDNIGSWGDSTWTGSITFSSLSGRFSVGEVLHDPSENVIGTVSGLGYTIYDVADYVGGNTYVNITSVNGKSNWSHIKFLSGGAYRSVLNWPSYIQSELHTTNQSVNSGAETSVLYNGNITSTDITRDGATGEFLILTQGRYRISVEAVIDSVTVGNTHTLKIYDNGQAIAFRTVVVTDNATNIQLNINKDYEFDPGRKIKVTYTQNEGIARSLVAGTQYLGDKTRISITRY